MCRFVAVAADRPVGLDHLLLSAPHALVRQSNRDRRGLCHDSGWGVGFYTAETPDRVRSTLPAWQDPLYRDTVERVRTRVAVGHVRLATVGRVAERNCHPFAAGRWLFAHNGTLVGFAAEPDPLLRLIPAPYRDGLDGETDSEHVFRFLLGRLDDRAGSDADAVAAVVRDAVRDLADLYPGSDADPTRLNLIVTDGRTLVAVRWGHWLYRLDQAGPGPVAADDGAAVRVVALASEPVADEGWVEVPDRSVVLVRDDLTTASLTVPGAAPARPPPG